MSKTHEKNRRSSRQLLIGLGVLVVAAIGLFALWKRGVVGRQAGDAALARASAAAAAKARSDKPRVAYRAVHLSGGSARPVEATAIGSLTGRVISSGSGRAVAGAELTFVGPSGAQAVASGEGGRFELIPSREGAYELTLITASGFLPFAPELGSSPIVLVARRGVGISGVTLQIDPIVEYTGLVVDPSGTPVAGAEVVLHDANHYELGLSALKTRFVSDDKGEFRFVAPDSSILEANKAGYAPARARVNFAVQVSKRLKLTLGKGEAAPSGAIAGRVVDERGVGRPEAWVSARVQAELAPADESMMNPGARTRSGADGSFSLEGLSPATYRVVASDGTSAPAVAERVTLGGPPLMLVLKSGSTLSGRVTERASGTPILAFTIVVAERRGPLALETVRVASSFDSSGAYRVHNLAPGSYVVTATALGFAPAPEQEVRVEGDSKLDFALERGARVVGTVRDAKTHAPLEGAKVSLESRLDASAGSVPLQAAALTGPDGGFDLPGLGPGERSLLVLAEAHHSRLIGGIHVVGSETIGPLTIDLTPTDPGEEPRIELFGIGAVLSAKDEALVITRVIAGGGAADAGLKVGDAILAVDGKKVTELGFELAIQRIRGPEGTRVALLVSRAEGGEPALLEVTRKPVKA